MQTPLILFQLRLRHSETIVYSYSEGDQQETRPWSGVPVKSPVLTHKPGNDEADNTSFWSDIRKNLVDFHADYGFGFHDRMTTVLRERLARVIADNQEAVVVSVSVEMHLFTENRISNPSWDMFGEVVSFVVEHDLESKVHNIKRFKLLSHQEEEEEEEKITCAICLEDVVGDDQEEEEEVHGMKLVSCTHVFHEDCLLNWLKEKDDCPMCRRPSCLQISKDDETDDKTRVID